MNFIVFILTFKLNKLGGGLGSPLHNNCHVLKYIYELSHCFFFFFFLRIERRSEP